MKEKHRHRKSRKKAQKKYDDLISQEEKRKINCSAWKTIIHGDFRFKFH